jgi:hypothetical protein
MGFLPANVFQTLDWFKFSHRSPPLQWTRAALYNPALFWSCSSTTISYKFVRVAGARIYMGGCEIMVSLQSDNACLGAQNGPLETPNLQNTYAAAAFIRNNSQRAAEKMKWPSTPRLMFQKQ